MRRTESKARNRVKPDPTGPLALLVLGLLVAQCMRVAFTSPKLRLERVDITGTERLSDQRVLELTGIRLHRNVFRIDLHATAARLKQEPIVRTASVTRVLPNTLLIELGERRPALQVKVDGDVWLVDNEGVVYEHAAGLAKSLPILDACRQDLPSPGEKVRKELLETVATCRVEAKKRKLGLLSMRVDAARELWLHVAAPSQPATPSPAGSGRPTVPAPGGMLVRIGRATDIPAKLNDVQQALLAWPEWGAKASYLDVMCAGQPAYKQLDDVHEPTKTARAD
jgi:hypothetical protein